MQTIGAFEAKNQLSRLLKEVATGKKIAITKHGLKIAYLVPVEFIEQEIDPATQAAEALRKLRENVTLGSELDVKSMKDSGRP